LPLLNSWHTWGDSAYKTEISLSYHSYINTSTIRVLVTIGPGSGAHRITVSIIWTNKTALALTNYPRYRRQFSVYWNSNSDYVFFGNLPAMLGIPVLYYPNSSNLEPRCFIGFDSVSLSGSPYMQFGNEVSFDTGGNPITQISVTGNYLAVDGSGNGLNPQPYSSHYHFFCFDGECPTTQYFN
jgi:hypothetical protein